MPVITKIKKGAETCTVEDLCFPVSLNSNPRRTNSEYSMVVTGIIKGFVSQGEEGEEVEVEVQDEPQGEIESVETVEVEGVEVDLNYCSPRYELVPNSTIFPNIESVLKGIRKDALTGETFEVEPVEYTVEYKHINHVRFYAQYTITDKRFAYIMAGTNDVIQPMITVQHSYNGLTKYKIIFGYFRLVCTNGMTIPVSEMKKFNLVIEGKHTEIIRKSVDMLAEKLEYFVANAQDIKREITAQYERLASRFVTDVKARIEEVLEAAKIIAVDNKKFNTVNDIESRIMVEANKEGFGYNGKVNDWLIYNGINQYLNDDTRNIAVPEKRMETDSKVLEYMLYY
jgi:hypothetical protein